MFINNRYFVPPLTNLALVDPSDDLSLAPVALHECKDLGSLVVNRLFDETLINYGKNYQNSVANSSTFFNHMREVASLLKSLFPITTNILEVGCGKGDFFEILSDEGFKEMEGFDTAYEGLDPRIKSRYLDDTDEKKNIELVIMRHVLEHISNPYSILKKIQSICSESSHIYIEVPNFDWVLENQEFNEISFEHVNYFTLNSLSEIFNKKILRSGTLFNDQYIYVIAKLSDLSNDYLNTYNSACNWTDLDLRGIFKNYLLRLQDLCKLAKGFESIYIWGGATRAVLFLHICKYNYPELFKKIKFAIDINPKRQGMYLPSSKLRVIPPEEFYALASQNDLLLIANQNYSHEIDKELNKHLSFDMKSITLTDQRHSI